MKLLARSGAHRRRRAPSRPTSAGPPLRRPTSSPPSGPSRSAPRSAALLRLVPLTAAWRSDRRRQNSVQRRRARALLMAAVLFAAIVLLSALPWSTLLNQRSQLTTDTAEVSQLQAENRQLAAQARQLANGSTQNALARQDYGLVKPGQTAYDVLPPPGSTPSNATESGHVPLDEPPVVPGSRRSEELLGAGVLGSTSSAGSTPSATTSRRDRTGPAATTEVAARSGLGGFWSRVGHTLEFWN